MGNGVKEAVPVLRVTAIGDDLGPPLPGRNKRPRRLALESRDDEEGPFRGRARQRVESLRGGRESGVAGGSFARTVRQKTGLPRSARMTVREGVSVAADQPVAEATGGEQEAWVLRVGLNLPSQALHMDGEGLEPKICRGAPEDFKDPPGREGLPTMAGQETEQLEFPVREMDRTAAAIGVPTVQVQDNLAQVDLSDPLRREGVL